MALKLVMLPPQSSETRTWAQRLASALPEFHIVAPDDERQAADTIVDADAAYGTLPPDVLSKGKRLRWLQASKSAPRPGFYYPELVAHPVQVTNMRETFNDHIGSHIMAFVLAFARGFQHYLPHQHKCEWRPLPQDEGVVHLPEATALIVGVGGVGAEAARLCGAFGMRVIGIDPRRETAPPGVVELHRPEKLDELLPLADFVILTAPHTPATEGMFNRSRFQRMKRTAFFINTGRGKTTRLKDLTAALQAGEIAGAGLDVFEEESGHEGARERDAHLRPDHPLWTMPGVLMTPHTAMYGPYVDERRFQILLANCRRFAAGEPLLNLVDKQNWF